MLFILMLLYCETFEISFYWIHDWLQIFMQHATLPNNHFWTHHHDGLFFFFFFFFEFMLVPNNRFACRALMHPWFLSGVFLQLSPHLSTPAFPRPYLLVFSLLWIFSSFPTSTLPAPTQIHSDKSQDPHLQCLLLWAYIILFSFENLRGKSENGWALKLPFSTPGL